MNRISKVITGLIVILGMVFFSPVQQVWSADEDIDPQIYLVFNPETGEFTTESKPSDTGAGDQGGQATATASTSAPGQAAGTHGNMAATPAGSEQPSSGSSANDGAMSPAWIGSAVAIFLLGGIIIYKRKSHQHKLT